MGKTILSARAHWLDRGERVKQWYSSYAMRDCSLQMLCKSLADCHVEVSRGETMATAMKKHQVFTSPSPTRIGARVWPLTDCVRPGGRARCIIGVAWLTEQHKTRTRSWSAGATQQQPAAFIRGGARVQKGKEGGRADSLDQVAASRNSPGRATTGYRNALRSLPPIHRRSSFLGLTPPPSS